MIDKELRKRIIALVHQEVVPAIGCTEPMCVALCTARATEKLGCRPDRIEALLSANIYSLIDKSSRFGSSAYA